LPLQPLPSKSEWWDQLKDDDEDALEYDIAKELVDMGIPHPPRDGSISWTAYEEPSYALQPLRESLQRQRDVIVARAKNHLPMQYHAVIRGAVQDAITDAACTINNHVAMVASHTELWGVHLNLWDTQTRNHVVNEAQATNTTETNNAIVVIAINDLRNEALAVEDKTEAVNTAIIGTVVVLEEAFASGGIATVQGLSTALSESWAEAVNS
jgi:hypothetical protein